MTAIKDSCSWQSSLKTFKGAGQRDSREGQETGEQERNNSCDLQQQRAPLVAGAFVFLVFRSEQSCMLMFNLFCECVVAELMNLDIAHLIFIKLDKCVFLWPRMFCFKCFSPVDGWCVQPYDKQTLISSCNASLLHFSLSKLFERQVKPCCVLINYCSCFPQRFKVH